MWGRSHSAVQQIAQSNRFHFLRSETICQLMVLELELVLVALVAQQLLMAQRSSMLAAQLMLSMELPSWLVGPKLSTLVWSLVSLQKKEIFNRIHV